MSCLLYTGYCLILFERSIFGYSEILESTRVYADCTTVDFLEYQKSIEGRKGLFSKKKTLKSFDCRLFEVIWGQSIQWT